jgi:hypothetical protein
MSEALSCLCSLHSPIGWRQVFKIALNRCGSSLSEIPELPFDIDNTFPTTVMLLIWQNSRQLFSSNIDLDNVCACHPAQLAPENILSTDPTPVPSLLPSRQPSPSFALHNLLLALWERTDEDKNKV